MELEDPFKDQGELINSMSRDYPIDHYLHMVDKNEKFSIKTGLVTGALGTVSLLAGQTLFKDSPHLDILAFSFSLNSLHALISSLRKAISKSSLELVKRESFFEISFQNFLDEFAKKNSRGMHILNASNFSTEVLQAMDKKEKEMAINPDNVLTAFEHTGDLRIECEVYALRENFTLVFSILSFHGRESKSFSSLSFPVEFRLKSV